MAGEKTEKATSKKRSDQRKEGNVVISQDIVSAVVLICIFGTLKTMGQQFGNDILGSMRFFFGTMGQHLSGIADMKQRFGMVIIIAGEVLAPLFIVNIAVSIIATMAQTRMLVTATPLKIKFSKLNPITGMKNLFSAKALGETAKSIAKMAVIIYIIYTEVKDKLPQLLTIYNAEVGVSVSWTAQLVLDIAFRVSEAFLVIGVIDYFYQWWSYERNMKMSKQDIKDEYKQSEGSPETKSRIKGMQMKIARSRMMQSVPSADVVIRNPTHYAIALKYDREHGHAPIVVAKGQNNIALKIVEVALASNVHVIENKPLAQALYKTVEIGDEIPEEFYKAVAEVLAYIYKLKRAGRS